MKICRPIIPYLWVGLLQDELVFLLAAAELEPEELRAVVVGAAEVCVGLRPELLLRRLLRQREPPVHVDRQHARCVLPPEGKESWSEFGHSSDNAVTSLGRPKLSKMLFKSIMIAYGPAGDVQGSQVLGGVERALYELRQPRVVLGLARSLQNGRVLFQLRS